MVKICLTAAIFKNTVEKSNIFSSLISKFIHEDGETDGQSSTSRSLRELISLSESMVVLEKFITRFENIEKMFFETDSRKLANQDSKEFALISKLILGVVG